MEELVTCPGCAHQHAPDVSNHAAQPDASGGLDRRELLKHGGLAAAAALLLAACRGVGGLAGPGTPSGSVTIKLSDYPQLASVGGVAVLNGYLIAVENTGSGYIALSLVCPHRGGTIAPDGSGFRCPVHGATFDDQGNWIGGQPTSNMKRLSVSSGADGTLTVG